MITITRSAARTTTRRFATAVAVLAALVLLLGRAPGAEAAVIMECDGLPATLVGTPGNDNLVGTNGPDVIVGLGGDDRIRGMGDDDVICGGDGDDDINGGNGNDRVFGEDGDDDLQGGKGDDLVDGGEDDDTVKGGDGDDTLLGGGGTNTVRGGRGFDNCSIGDAGTARQCENAIPDAVDDGYSTDEDTALSVAAPGVLGNDVDTDGDPLTVTGVEGGAANVGVQITLPSGALLTLNADGSFDYDPNGQFESLAAGETDSDSFTYRAEDPLGTGDTATVTITITGVNDPPTANDDSGTGFETDEDSAFTTASVLDNDTDPDASDTLSVSALDTTGTSGLVTDNGDGRFLYDPNGQFESLAVGETDTDTFGYTVSDGNGGSDTATVTITITGVNDAPTANDDASASFTTDEDTAFTTGSVLGNDTDPDASDTLSVLSFDTTGTSGLVTSNGDGTFDYDPNGQFESLNNGDTDTDTFEGT